MMLTLGERLKWAIKHAGLNQKKVATILEIPETTLSNIIKNKYEPGCYKIKQIADYLNVDLHWLITGKEYIRGRYDRHGNIISSANVGGDQMNSSSLSVTGDHNVIAAERRNDHRGEYMTDIISKSKRLNIENREKLLKMLNAMLDIQEINEDLHE